MENTAQQLPEPVLKQIYKLLLIQAKKFKQRVGEECCISLPTYYRIVHDKRHLSRAERDKIFSILEEMMSEMKNEIDQIKVQVCTTNLCTIFQENHFKSHYPGRESMSAQ